MYWRKQSTVTITCTLTWKSRFGKHNTQHQIWTIRSYRVKHEPFTRMAFPRFLASKCILRSPWGGHCFLYSVSNSWSKQLSYLPPIGLEHIKANICIETVTNGHQYLHFLHTTNRSSILAELRSYLINKHYNQAFCDIVPSIIANGLQTNLLIYNETADHSHERITVAP